MGFDVSSRSNYALNQANLVYKKRGTREHKVAALALTVAVTGLVAAVAVVNLGIYFLLKIFF
jgi:hypothetical protein